MPKVEKVRLLLFLKVAFGDTDSMSPRFSSSVLALRG
jgi:hypothetical protein